MTKIFLAGFLFIFLFCACRQNESYLFTQLDASTTGIKFKNTLEESESANVLKYSYFYNGGGVAIGDINNDGLPDILFTGNMVRNRLYLNMGNFEFEDITDKSGIANAQGWCTGATMTDINGDGHLDIYICRSADAIAIKRKNLLYINNGDLTFSEQAAKYGLADEGYSSQAAFFDYDKDGDLDMFLINHSLQQYANEGIENPAARKNRQPAFANKLYRNDNGYYNDVSAHAGITSNVLTFGLGLALSDFNNDNWPDVYVSNDFNEPDYFFINNHDGTFTERLADCMDEVSLFSMGSDAADYNNDGLTDIVTLDMLQDDNKGQKMHNGAENFDKFQMLYKNGMYYQSSRNMLHKNNGDGTFSEIGQLAGVSATDWSWSALFCDYDNDGLKDLLITNGYAKDYTDMDFIKYSMSKTIKERAGEKTESVLEYIAKMPAIIKENYIFKNKGNNAFEKYNAQWGLAEEDISAGAAYADLDNDGDMDIVVNNINQEAGIYRNNLRSSNYIKIKLAGTRQNPGGIGAKIKIRCKNDLFYQEQFPARGFQSSVDPILNFGLGKYKVIDSIIIAWPDGKVQKISQVKSNQQIIIDEKNAVAGALTINHEGALFSTGNVFPYQHTENDFNDFTVQPLMPNYLSRMGPCMIKADINNDDLEDVFVGGAKNKKSAIFVQNKDGSFKESRQPFIWADSASEDVAAEFFDADGDGYADLYIGSGGYEFNENDPGLQHRLYLNKNGTFVKQQLPNIRVSAGCVKGNDIDGDGDNDLFIGGRVIPGKYPSTPVSYILLNNGKGVFTIKDSMPIGMVTSAAWADVTGDKIKDLIVVGEWMPILVYKNENGTLKDISSSYIKFPSNGWWHTVFTGDMDNDGDEDIIIGNTGLNTQFKVNDEQPFTLYYKDFDNNGSIDPVLCYYINGTSYPAASRDDLTDQLPFLRKKFIEYHTYANATIKDIFTTDQLKDAKMLTANCMSSIYLENKGAAGLVQHELPQEAQYSPVYAITSIDADKDGKKDLVLAGNNTWTRIKFGRYRANHGFLLKGDGKGRFSYIPQYKSGINLRDNVRSILTINNYLIAGANGKPITTYTLN